MKKKVFSIIVIFISLFVSVEMCNADTASPNKVNFNPSSDKHYCKYQNNEGHVELKLDANGRVVKSYSFKDYSTAMFEDNIIPLSTFEPNCAREIYYKDVGEVGMSLMQFSFTKTSGASVMRLDKDIKGVSNNKGDAIVRECVYGNNSHFNFQYYSSGKLLYNGVIGTATYNSNNNYGRINLSMVDINIFKNACPSFIAVKVTNDNPQKVYLSTSQINGYTKELLNTKKTDDVDNGMSGVQGDKKPVDTNKIKEGFGATYASCEDLLGSEAYSAFKNVLTFVQFGGPILAAVLTVLDYIKAAASGEQKNFKKASTDMIKRIIAAIFLILSPVIVNVILTLLDITGVYKCW